MPSRPAGDGKRPHFCGLSLATRMRCPATPGVASALARLEPRVALADHEDLATATHDHAVAVTGLRRFQGGQDLHDIPLKTIGTSKPAILMGIPPPIQALARFFSDAPRAPVGVQRSEEHTSELQSLMRISYAVFCLKKKK